LLLLLEEADHQEGEDQEGEDQGEGDQEGVEEHSFVVILVCARKKQFIGFKKFQTRNLAKISFFELLNFAF
jgi:hypothetical protein